MQHPTSRAWLAGASFLLIALGSTASGAGSSVVTAAAISLNQDQSAAFLHAMSVNDDKWLKSLHGMTPDAVTRILSFRKGGKSFSSLSQVREVSGLSTEQFDNVQKGYLDAEFAPEDAIGGAPVPAQERPSTPPAAQRTRRGRMGTAQPGQRATPDATPKAPAAPALDLEVKGGYYSILPGYDLEKLDPQKRRIFLDKINSEQCSCGCSNDTLGECLVNDPGCQVVKARVRKVYTDIFGSAPPAPAGSGAAH